MKKSPNAKRGFCILLAMLMPVFLVHRHNKQVPTFVPQRISNAVLIIDAGHGGEDGGAVSPNGTIESNINLEISLRTAGLMDLYGIPYLLLRDTDRSLHDETCDTLREKKISDLRNRVAAVENTPNAVVLSIHQNTFSNSKYHGAQVFFSNHEDSLPFAQIVQNTLRGVLDPENSRTPTAIPASVYLMNHITCPAILVECGFLSNPAEEALLNTPEYQTKLAVSLVSAYITFQETSKEELIHESS